jgi:hypothetical protein
MLCTLGVCCACLAHAVAALRGFKVHEHPSEEEGNRGPLDPQRARVTSRTVIEPLIVDKVALHVLVSHRHRPHHVLLNQPRAAVRMGVVPEVPASRIRSPHTFAAHAHRTRSPHTFTAQRQPAGNIQQKIPTSSSMLQASITDSLAAPATLLCRHTRHTHHVTPRSTPSATHANHGITPAAAKPSHFSH